MLKKVSKTMVVKALKEGAEAFAVTREPSGQFKRRSLRLCPYTGELEYWVGETARFGWAPIPQASGIVFAVDH